MREARVTRKTNETDIAVSLAIDGAGRYEIDTGCGFLDHMLELMTRHGRFDIAASCRGDTRVDDHHTVEDVGIALGQAFRDALGDMRGINRYGSFLLPMDEALALVALDISGRTTVAFDVAFPTEKIGAFDTQLVREFFLGFARALPMTVHMRMLAGENSHHIAEALFKGFGRALRVAVALDPACADEIPSTKGVLI